MYDGQTGARGSLNKEWVGEAKVVYNDKCESGEHGVLQFIEPPLHASHCMLVQVPKACTPCPKVC